MTRGGRNAGAVALTNIPRPPRRPRAVLPGWGWCAVLYLVASLVPSLARAQSEAPAPLPEPLTLEAALALTDEPHPELRRARSEVEAAAAELALARSAYGLNASIEGRLQYVEPNRLSPYQSNNDSSIALVVRKRLYDFGRTRARSAAAQAEIESRERVFVDLRNGRVLEILADFLDVLEADLAYARDNEAMAIAYVRLDRLQNRQELGEVSDLAVLEQQAAYEALLARRARSESRQRTSRAELAATLNRPGQLPSSLVWPEFPGLERELPDARELIQQARDHHPGLAALQARVAAARSRILAARAEARPIVRAEAEVSGWERPTANRDDWRAGLVVEVPFLTGGTVDAQAARAQAELAGAQAELDDFALALEQAVREALEDVYVARSQVRQTATLMDFRDLDLDRSRALYELEVQADLGDAMAEWSAGRLERVQAEHALVLALARLDALTGGPIMENLLGQVAATEVEPLPPAEPGAEASPAFPTEVDHAYD